MAYRETIRADNPWGYWPLQETSGTTAHDDSGNGRHGTYVGNPLLGVGGPFTNSLAVNFDAVDDYVQLPSATILTNGSYTVEGWVFLVGEERVWFDAYTSNAIGEYLFCFYRPADRRLIHEVGGAGQTISPETDLLGRWAYVAFTYDLATDTSRLYLNGVLVGQASAGPFTGANPDTRIGWRQGPLGAGVWRGRIAHVAIYGAVLSAPRIAAHYEAGVNEPSEVISDFTPTPSGHAEYRLDVHTAAGVKVAEVTDFLALSYTRRVNAPGLLTVTLRGDHPALAGLELDGQAIVYRRNPAIGLSTWTADFWGLWRYQERRYTDHDVVELRFPGLLSLLARRIVAWKAGTSNRSSFQNVTAETVMKTLVRYNAGSQATTANGRIRNGAITGLAVEADQARGNTISKDCAYRNLLEVLQELALISGGDFDLVKTGSQTFEFRFYPGQRGVDRSATLLFALERGNMAEPVYRKDRTEEATVAIAAGQGEGSDRQVVVRTGPDYSSANDIETFVDQRNAQTTDALNSAGDQRLRETRATDEFEFNVLQLPTCYYGVHYTLGDLVKAQYGPVNVTQKVVGVVVTVGAEGGEQIDVEMKHV